MVGRNPDLVLQSRVADYRHEMLYELAYVERLLYDYWDKMTSILPMQDWPYLALQRVRWRDRHLKLPHHQRQVEAVSRRFIQ